MGSLLDAASRGMDQSSAERSIMPARIILCLLLEAVLMVLSQTGSRAMAAEAFKSGVVAAGLWSDPVFRSEASGAARIVAGRYGHGGPVIVMANSVRSLVAGPDDIARALAAAQRGLDPQRDVLFLVLTSHGSPKGIVEKGGGRMGIVPPDELGAILAQSPIRQKVLIVSACFAGIYTGLADADTLVITAADATHPSFGCVPGATWTYFGEALFAQALRHTASLTEAFADARTIVAARERAQGFDPSNPQMAGGANGLATLNGAR